MTLLLLASLAVASPFDGPPPACDDVYPPTGALEVFVVTMSPGEEPFSLVGHTAAWVRRGGSFDRVFNFGTFSSLKQDPLSALVLGTLEVSWTARDRDVEIGRYARRHRTVLAQRLQLPADRVTEVAKGLAEHSEKGRDPELFHWFENNCSTGVRDLIDGALDGALSEALAGDAPMTPRQEVLRHLSESPPLWFAWDHTAGPWADRPVSRYASAHIPERLSEELSAMSWTWPDGVSRPLSGPVCTLHPDRHGAPPATPPRWEWACWGLGGLGALVVVGGGTRPSWPGRAVAGVLLAALGIVAGVLGTANMVLAAVSALEGFGPNRNWLVTSPLSFLLVPVGWRLARRGAAGLGALGRWAQLLAALAVLGVLVAPLPWLAQDNLAILGLFAPAVLAAGWLARRR